MMSATPRTIRTVAMPSAPRLRRVSRVYSRPFGSITVFLVSVAILGVTCLCYVWQSGQAQSTASAIPGLTAELNQAQNQREDLQNQINTLESYGNVVQEAAAYRMYQPDQSTVRVVVQPRSVITQVVTVPVVVPRAAPLRLPSTDAAVAAWWQSAWIALYQVLR